MLYQLLLLAVDGLLFSWSWSCRSPHNVVPTTAARCQRLVNDMELQGLPSMVYQLLSLTVKALLLSWSNRRSPNCVPTNYVRCQRFVIELEQPELP